MKNLNKKMLNYFRFVFNTSKIKNYIVFISYNKNNTSNLHRDATIHEFCEHLKQTLKYQQSF